MLYLALIASALPALGVALYYTILCFALTRINTSLAVHFIELGLV